ncbi:hypothetical protein CTI12_AA156450 [Artemisia annua]|uniref:Uncharacterized protein n=1 Tax=Artemisia annua TaxID=35608 RepID=A0A2U1PFM7_ARTAN|nr:hypothetical protein CTI12_AA156450 [Artemisia annua]
MEITGPSPIVPFLIVNALALIIFSPMVQNLAMIPVLLILVIYFFSSFFSSQDTSAVSYQDQSGSSHEDQQPTQHTLTLCSFHEYAYMLVGHIKRILYWCSTRHTKMRVGGPSPLVPSLFVCVLGLVIFSSTLENLWETISSFFIGEDVILFLPILLLLLILISTFLPTRYNSYSYESSSSSHFDSEGFGFGFGYLLLALLFIILCHVFA